MIITIYQAELVHSNFRGLVIGLQQLMLGIGGVCGIWISCGTILPINANGASRQAFRSYRLLSCLV